MTGWLSRRTPALVLALGALTLVATVAMVSPAGAQTQPPAATQDHDHDHAATQPPAGTAATSNDMTKMMAQMHASESKIADLAAKMNAAKGDAQVTAVVALLNALVQDQKAMHEEMMSHMMNMNMMPMAGQGRGMQNMQKP